tara:strand:- start:4107 stop:4238 length:132 start_codon:yes stop_codon:yes gene_type:complete
MKKLTSQELEELINGDSDADAVNRKEQRKKKKKHNHIYNKESE